MKPVPLHHAAIGNGRILALVRPGGCIDWASLPRFDSPPLFCALLDEARGGRFDVAPAGEGWEVEVRYLPHTNVVRHLYRRGGDAFEVVDFAPREVVGPVAGPPEIRRLLRPLAGAPQVRVRFDPVLDYGAARPPLVPSPAGIVAEGTGGERFVLATTVPQEFVLASRAFELKGSAALSLAYGAVIRDSGVVATEDLLARTIRAWQVWVKHCAIPSHYAPEVIRSALALRLHVFDDTGAIIAAATTSLPEALGSGRTWDYRFCWLRDAYFVLEAFREIGQLEEAEQFVGFLADVMRPGAPPLQPVYGVAGEADLPERIITSLSGYDGVGPVRVGNAAARHLQTDIYGEMVGALTSLAEDPRVDPGWPARVLPLVARLAEQADAGALEHDSGIWEFRSELKHHTFSLAMCWFALDRAARFARRHGRKEEAQRWGRRARELRACVLRRGYNRRLGYFTQALDGRFADATSLLLPMLGLLPSDDRRMRSTLDRYRAILAPDGLVRRYVHADDFGTPTSAFTICSFWWVQALAEAGRIDEAEALFQRLLALANPVGLFSEDVDVTSGALLGNFPQAYTHVGLILAAFALDRAWERGRRRRGPEREAAA